MFCIDKFNKTCSHFICNVEQFDVFLVCVFLLSCLCYCVSGGSRAAGAALPPRAATVATKTPAATAMVWALPTINNQLKVSVTMAMETTTTTTNKT
jgi:hypothetical protein